MFFHNLNPALLDIGPLEIRYYGLFYALGFVLVYLFLPYLAKRKGINLTKDDAADFLIYVILGVIIGSRAVYAFVYNFGFFISNPLEIFAFWSGGLSFHGGLIGAVIAAYFFSRKKKIHFYDIADLIVIPAALGLMLGRIGNFMNAELIGGVTDISWCINYSQNQYVSGLPDDCRHPSQIYASVKNLTIFAVLWFIKDKKLPRGFMFWSFVSMYGLFRTIVEFFRQPDPQIGFLFGYLSMGQLLSFPLFVLGVYMLYRLKKNHA